VQFRATQIYITLRFCTAHVFELEGRTVRNETHSLPEFAHFMSPLYRKPPTTCCRAGDGFMSSIHSRMPL